MKAVIVDLLNGQAAALRDDGRVVKLADAGYSLGQIVELREKGFRRGKLIRFISAAAAAAVLLVGGGGAAAYAMPYGVVSLDVNPSLEYTINRFDYVLRVEGVNEEGRAFLDGMDQSRLLHRPIEQALEESIAGLEAGNWLEGEDGEILLAAGTRKEAHSERLVSELESRLRREGEGREIHTVTVSEEELGLAREEGVSAGRGRMLRELSEQEGADFVPGEWAERPIRDMIDRLERGPMPQEPPAPFHEEDEAPAPAQNGEQRQAQTPAEERREQPAASHGDSEAPAPAQNGEQREPQKAQTPAEERREPPAQEDRAPVVLERREDTQGAESPAAPEALSGGEPVGEIGLPQSPGGPADFGGGHFGGGGPSDGGGGPGPGGMGH